MKRLQTIFLQAVVVFVAFGILVLMLWEPHLEGRNAHATAFEIYFEDPFLAYAYAASVPFFMVFFRIFSFLGLIRNWKGISVESAETLMAAKRSATAFACLVLMAMVAFGVIGRGEEDAAGGVALGLLAIVFAIVTAVSADVLEGLVRQAGSDWDRQ